MIVKSLTALFIILFSAFFQMTPFLSFDLVKPNLVLLVFLALIVLGWSLEDILPALAAAVFIFGLLHYWWFEALVMAGIVLALFLFNKVFQGQTILNFLLMIFLATAGFYVLTEPRSFISNLGTFGREMLLNVPLGLLFYWLGTKIKYEEITQS